VKLRLALPRRFLAGAALAAWTTTACRPATTTRAPADDSQPVPWYQGDALAARAISAKAAQGSRADRVARVDALLDLLDAARFADDAGAREQLWLGLGGTPRDRGPEATRDAATRILGEAIALDKEPLADDSRAFIGGVISLLSADLGLGGAAEDLAIRTAAYRDVAEHGHPRAADNARWRLHDHLHGCLQGAVSAPQERRVDVAIQGLYVREDSLAAWLDDRAVHAREPAPDPAALLELLSELAAPLAADPRWSATITRRAAADEALAAAVRTTLPAHRDPTWPLASTPQGTARPDSLAPIVRVDAARVTVDLGRPQVREAAGGAPELVRAVEGALALDGRGTVLLVAPPMLPSPALAAIARTFLDARVARVELAVREPRVPADRGDVVVQLPLELFREVDRGPTATALRAARLHVHLSGRGARLALDGRWLELRVGADLEAALAVVRRAYPRERVITIGLADDVLYAQLLDLVRVLIGGPQRSFEVAVWRPGVESPPVAPVARTIAAEERRLQQRAALGQDSARASLKQAYPLAAGDQPRLETAARQLLRCLPELEAPLAAGDPVELGLVFNEGRLAQVTGERPRGKLGPDRLLALQRCAEAELRGFRLREHRDKITVDVALFR
jgi:hypothetical protein